MTNRENVMTNRENVIRALKRNNPKRVPFDFTVCPCIQEKLVKHIGTKDYRAYFGIPMRYIGLNPTRKSTDFSEYYEYLPKNARPLDWLKEWGVMGVDGSTAHFQEMLHPMKEFSSINEINGYPFPDFNEDYRWEGIAEKVCELKKNDFVAIAGMQTTIFETAWYLRGMDEFLVDMMTDVNFAETLLDKITEIRIGMSEKYSKAGFDILQLGDDVATQLNMMMNPELWRSLIKPRLERIIRAAKSANPDILVFYHGDGNMSKIIVDLIEIGVDILNPVQPECMDPIEIKESYGDELAFWGTLGTQTTLPFGTPQQVKDTCKRLIEKVGTGGGLVLSPSHVVEPEVPLENLLAFVQTVQEYGTY